MNPFKFKYKDMVYFLSNNKIAYGWIEEVFYRHYKHGQELKYKIKASFHGRYFEGEERKEAEIFSSKDELIVYLSQVTLMQ